MIIGAVHLPPLGQGSTRSDSKWTGQVGNIKYEVNISSAARKKIDATTLKKIESDIGPKVHEYVKTALTKIQELGFMTKEERNKEKIKERTLNVSFRVASEAQSWYEWSKPEYGLKSARISFMTDGVKGLMFILWVARPKLYE